MRARLSSVGREVLITESYGAGGALLRFGATGPEKLSGATARAVGRDWRATGQRQFCTKVLCMRRAVRRAAPPNFVVLIGRRARFSGANPDCAGQACSMSMDTSLFSPSTVNSCSWRLAQIASNKWRRFDLRMRVADRFSSTRRGAPRFSREVSCI